MTEGAVNVLYLPVFKKDGSFYSMTSVLIRVSEHTETEDGTYTVRCGNTVYSVKDGDSFVFPNITDTPNGFVCEGWTDGEQLYLPGETVKVTKSFSVFVRYIRTEIFSAMVMAN